ncbi:MAG TPA: glycosyltransferase family 4 protein, partial [Ferruginibacter sp.]|nr:glycosyltransferase family 4 protein [Ferruginibacter sp.]
MKVLHILYSGLGGHGNVFFSMLDADEANEFDFVPVFFGVEEVREEYIKKAEANNLKWFFVKKKPGIDLEAYNELTSIIKAQLPDIIFLHSSAYIFPARKAVKQSAKKIKIIVRETQANHLKTKQEWLGLCIALLKADKVVFLSKEYRDAVRKKLYFIFRNKKTVVIPNGINLQLFSPSPAHDNVIRIGMQSRLTASKDHETLIKAFAECITVNKTGKKIELHIAGDGEMKQDLQQLAILLGIQNNVVFTGLLPVNELPAFINSLTIYVHATLGETMSTAIMQVMACRVPVIA